MTNLGMKLQLWDNKPNIVIDGEADQEKAANEINQPADKDIKGRDIFNNSSRPRRRKQPLSCQFSRPDAFAPCSEKHI